MARSKMCQHLQPVITDRPYFRHLSENPFKKPVDSKTRDPEVQKCKLFSGVRTTLGLQDVLASLLMSCHVVHLYTQSMVWSNYLNFSV